MIDLRSDTVTRPDDAMRAAMAAAPVGDDVYGEDPTVNALETRVAALLGMDDAVFVPTGTMANQIALRAHTEPGDLAIAEASAHILINEAGAGAALAGVTFKALMGERGMFSADDVRSVLTVPHRFNPPRLGPRARVVCVENTHNGAGGTVWPLPRLRSVVAAAHEHGLVTHMDGARLWHAAAAEGVTLAELVLGFDSVSVCFSKGLGAPVGSVMAGGATVVERARRFKQQYGGGFRQAGVLAAAALHALEHNRPLLDQDIRNASRFARALEQLEGISIDLDSVQSNIVRFEVTGMAAAGFVDRCHAADVHMLPGGRQGVRAVFHRDISAAQVDDALDRIAGVLSRSA